ncbi:hypothetical protein Tco_1191621 [Tanacetum coccineum]
MSIANPQAAIVSEELLVPIDNRLKFKKNNQRVASYSNITDTLLKLVVGILKHHKIYKPVSLTATVHMPQPLTNKPYSKPHTEKQILAFIKTLGYDEDPKAKMTSISTFVATKLHQPWRAIMSVLNSIPQRSDAEMHSEGQDSPLTKLINTVDGKFKFEMDISDTMINDAIKQSAGYMYYKIKKDKSNQEVNVPIKPKKAVVPHKPRTLIITENIVKETVAVELEKSRQMEKDVEDTYVAETGLKLKEGLEVGSIRRIQGIGYGVLGFLRVGTTLDIFQNIIFIPYFQYGILVFSGYGVLIYFPLWSLVSAGMDTPYLP